MRKKLFSVNNILFKYKVHRDITDTSYIQYSTFERDTEISLKKLFLTQSFSFLSISRSNFCFGDCAEMLCF